MEIIDKSLHRRKSTIKNLSAFDKFRQNVRILFLQIFYRKPQYAAPVSRSLVCNNYTSVLEVAGIIIQTVALQMTKQTQTIVFIDLFASAFLAVGYIITRIGINATYYKAIMLLKFIILGITYIFLYQILTYYQAVKQVCGALEDFYGTDIEKESLTACDSLITRYLITFISALIITLSRLINIFFFYKGYVHLQKILLEKRQKKKRKLRYSNVQKRKEMMKKEGYYTYNQNRKL